MGQKPIEGSNPSLSAIEKYQKKHDPAEEWKQRNKTGCFPLPAYWQLCKVNGGICAERSLNLERSRPAVVLVALRLHVSNLNESLDSAVPKDMEERVRAVDERITEVVF